MQSNKKPASAEDKKREEKKLDEAIKHSFPASDPVRPGNPTSTEQPARPKDRQAPLPSKADIEAARRGEGHGK